MTRWGLSSAYHRSGSLGLEGCGGCDRLVGWLDGRVYREDDPAACVHELGRGRVGSRR